MSTPTTTAPETAQQAIQAILNSATLVVGPSQSGKSTLLGTFAEWVWATYGKVTLYYLLDGGGFPVQVQELVNRGIIRLWKVRTRSAPGLAIETMQRMSQGWWPARINAKTGEVAPNVALVPPMTIAYQMICPSGHVAGSSPVQAGLTQRNCPTCKVLVTAQNMTVKKTATRTRGFEQVGAVVIDGITSAGRLGMDDMAHRELGGEKGNLGGIVSSGDMRFGSNNRAHYGFIQSRLEQMVLSSTAIPGLVVPPVWTALLQEGSDEGGLPIRGPQLPGQAALTQVTQWFGDTIETRILERDGKKIRAMHLESWMEQTNAGAIRHICGVRSFPGRLPAVIEEIEGVDVPLSKFNLGYFYTQREQVAAQIRDEYQQKYANAPGVPEGEVEYGDPQASPTVAAPAVAAPSAPAPRPSVPGAPTVPAPAPRPAAAPAPAPAPKPAVPAGSAPTVGAPVTPTTTSSTPAQQPPTAPAQPVVPGKPAVVQPPVAQPRRRVAPAVGAVQPAPSTAAAAPAPAPKPAAAPAPTPAPKPQQATPPPQLPISGAVPASAPNPTMPPKPPAPPVRAAVPPPPGRRPQ